MSSAVAKREFQTIIESSETGLLSDLIRILVEYLVVHKHTLLPTKITYDASWIKQIDPTAPINKWRKCVNIQGAFEYRGTMYAIVWSPTSLRVYDLSQKRPVFQKEYGMTILHDHLVYTVNKEDGMFYFSFGCNFIQIVEMKSWTKVKLIELRNKPSIYFATILC